LDLQKVSWQDQQYQELVVSWQRMTLRQAVNADVVLGGCCCLSIVH